MDIPTWVALVIIGMFGLSIRLAVWYGSVNSDRKTFTTFMNEVREDIKEIRIKLEEIFNKMPTPAYGSKSPLQLTEWSEELARKLRAHEWADEIASQAIKDIRAGTPYDIQKGCLEFVETFEDEKWLGIWKNVSFHSGESLKTVNTVLAIVLREKIWSEVEVCAV